MICKKSVLRNFENSQENTCARVSFFAGEACSYRTPPVATSVTSYRTDLFGMIEDVFKRYMNDEFLIWVARLNFDNFMRILVNRFSCNTRMILGTNSNPLVSNVKLL